MTAKPRLPRTWGTRLHSSCGSAPHSHTHKRRRRGNVNRRSTFPMRHTGGRSRTRGQGGAHGRWSGTHVTPVQGQKPTLGAPTQSTCMSLGGRGAVHDWSQLRSGRSTGEASAVPRRWRPWESLAERRARACARGTRVRACDSRGHFIAASKPVHPFVPWPRTF